MADEDIVLQTNRAVQVARPKVNTIKTETFLKIPLQNAEEKRKPLRHKRRKHRRKKMPSYDAYADIMRKRKTKKEP